MKMKPKSPNPVDVHVGNCVRVRRVLCGLSQMALADRLNLTFQQVQKYEKGSNRVSAGRLWQIAGVLGVSVEWFFVGFGDDTAPPPISTKRQTLELVRNLGACNPAIRASIYGLVKTLAAREPAATLAAE